MIWGAYMSRAKGSFCGDFRAPKEAFQPAPLAGGYSRSGPAAPTPGGHAPTDPTAPVPEPHDDQPPFDPETYETPPAGQGTG